MQWSWWYNRWRRVLARMILLDHCVCVGICPMQWGTVQIVVKHMSKCDNQDLPKFQVCLLGSWIALVGVAWRAFLSRRYVLEVTSAQFLLWWSILVTYLDIFFITLVFGVPFWMSTVVRSGNTISFPNECRTGVKVVDGNHKDIQAAARRKVVSEGMH